MTLTSDKIRVGLLIDSFVQPRWIHKIVHDIQASGIAKVVIVVKNGGQSPPKRFRFQRYWSNRAQLLYAAYSRFDEIKTRLEADAFENIDLEPLLSDCPVLDVEPVSTKHTDRLIDEDVDRILAYDLDVALRFGFRILKGRVLDIARHGVWSYHHGDSSVNRGGPAGFWEVMKGEFVTGSMLQILTEELDNGRVIYKSWSPTSDRFSVKANRNHYYWKSSTFVMRKLRELAETKEVEFEKNSHYYPYSERLYKTPTNSEMLGLLTRLAGKYAISKYRQLSYLNQWSLAYRFKSGPNDANDVFYRYRFLIPPKDRFWADPLPWKFGDQYFVFIEEYIYADGKGHISVIELDRDGIRSGPHKVLEKDYHLSYPFIFEWQDSLYMIPETAANDTVELYRCVSFPLKWELEEVLLDKLQARDATLMQIDNLWWMFASVGEAKFPSDWDELYLYYAQHPKGPWKPHKKNPVKTDVKGSRPAGRPFYYQGDLYRPAQDSSKFYGYAITLNKIIRITLEEFIEQEVHKIVPSWDKRVIGTHTINSADDLTVIDCLMRRRRI